MKQAGETPVSTTPDDEGITLVEIAVSAAVMAIAMAIFTGGIVQIFRTVNKVEALSDSQAQLLAAFRRLDREVRYASAFSQPSNAASAPGDSYVEYVLNTTATSTCVQLLLRGSTAKLMRRTWPKDAVTVTPTAWSLLLSSVSATVGADTPFDVDPGGTTFTSPTLKLDVAVTAGAGTTATRRQSTVTLAALNASSTAIADDTVCTDGRSIP